MTTETIKTIKTKNVTVRIDATVLPERSFWLNELFEGTDDHQGGVTVQVPSRASHETDYQFYIPEYSLADLSRDYATQGRENPSAEAYKSLQDELGYHLTARDCMIDCSVTVSGLILGSASAGIGFDYSPDHDERDLKDVALSVLSDHGYDFVREAIQEARDRLARLKSI